MNDSRRIAKLVAEHVMKWRLECMIGRPEIANWYPKGADVSRPPMSAGAMPVELWNPAENIAHAWRVLETFESGRVRKAGEWWYASIYPPGADDPVSVQESTAPLAICLAALKASGLELDSSL